MNAETPRAIGSRASLSASVDHERRQVATPLNPLCNGHLTLENAKAALAFYRHQQSLADHAQGFSSEVTDEAALGRMLTLRMIEDALQYAMDFPGRASLREVLHG